MDQLISHRWEESEILTKIVAIWKCIQRYLMSGKC